MIAIEEMHIGEVDKMLRKPGDIGVYTSSESPAGAVPRKRR
jgi:hypothetical protein